MSPAGSTCSSCLIWESHSPIRRSRQAGDEALYVSHIRNITAVLKSDAYRMSENISAPGRHPGADF
ncbi:hypothetical protein AGR3A_Lc40056 [Agrobacterium tomkonis CFBP 6623]|uniref:Uncharacterized protein n=1 Tax=Agrobacterium tomkonis CFBP 6623 TaxID=1183432 RepID=A0A1S7S5I6_9HYPH|nr:hypothetical protein AGR3A_Lc40056 [Agrobacterium tomkonis CFBP 6623]